eukprot:6282060-Amphidinium_carterae.1
MSCFEWPASLGELPPSVETQYKALEDWTRSNDVWRVVPAGELACGRTAAVWDLAVLHEDGFALTPDQTAQAELTAWMAAWTGMVYRPESWQGPLAHTSPPFAIAPAGVDTSACWVALRGSSVCRAKFLAVVYGILYGMSLCSGRMSTLGGCDCKGPKEFKAARALRSGRRHPKGRNRGLEKRVLLGFPPGLQISWMKAHQSQAVVELGSHQGAG